MQQPNDQKQQTTKEDKVKVANKTALSSLEKDLSNNWAIILQQEILKGK